MLKIEKEEALMAIKHLSNTFFARLKYYMTDNKWVI